jgi:hypothetical protein
VFEPRFSLDISNIYFFILVYYNTGGTPGIFGATGGIGAMKSDANRGSCPAATHPAIPSIQIKLSLVSCPAVTICLLVCRLNGPVA